MEQRNRGSKLGGPGAPGRRPWVLLAYRLPREPSTPRISVWRKLRQVGAVQIVDGLVALPADNRTREHITWLAEEIRSAAGDAWIWDAAAASRSQERELVEAMSRDITEEYEALANSATASMRDGTTGARTLSRLRREFHRIEARDYFGVRARQRAAEAIERLSRKLKDEVRR